MSGSVFSLFLPLYDFFMIFFTYAETPLMLRFLFCDPGPAQETVGGAGFELGTAASSVWCRPVALTN
jgi:hypothetical protein